MKILFVSHHNKKFLTNAEYIENAIRGFNIEVKSFELYDHIIPGRFKNLFPFLNKIDLKIINNKLLKVIKNYKPEVLLVLHGVTIHAESIERIKRLGVKTVLWTEDPPRDFDLILKAAPKYNYVFCQGTEAIELLEKSGFDKAKWLPMACDPEIHKHVDIEEQERKKYAVDIAFVGSVHESLYPFRVKTLEALSGFNLGIWGPGAEKLRNKSLLKDKLRGEQTSPEEWIRIYSSAKIILCMHYKDPNGEIPCYQASPRVFEALACNAFVICDTQKDVKELFKEGEHLEYFKDISELKEKIEYYLKNPELRKKIAYNGYKEVIGKHTYAVRLKKLFSEIGDDYKEKI